MNKLPPVHGPSEGPLIYVVYGCEDAPLYVGSTMRPISKRLWGLRSEYKLQRWERENGPLYVKTIGGFSSEVEIRHQEQKLIWDLQPLYNRDNIVTHLNGAMTREERSAGVS